MCRTGGRRCDGSNHTSRATQTTRKRVSRARKALREAKAGGDADAIAAAQQRLTAARAAHQEARETMRPNDDTAPHARDVTRDDRSDANTNPPSTQDTDRLGRATVRVVNNHVSHISGNATVYQADVIHGPLVFDTGPDRDVTTEPAPRTTRPTGTGRAKVQAGLIFGGIHGAAHDVDVTATNIRRTRHTD
ncbi:hypothetical protein AB0A74_24820 [Saccharothrix sp. NPDC042600]|uniref:hypothetical protein n=1 Tax=Saccharothrix TaxID=2071 RepID=UPI0034050492|nr:hypothetical protein GCM10017745_17910 [Saccharothrix mutabilis subsp. capreolus]